MFLKTFDGKKFASIYLLARVNNEVMLYMTLVLFIITSTIHLIYTKDETGPEPYISLSITISPCL